MEVDENPDVALLESCNTCKSFVAWPVYVRVHDLNCLSLSNLSTSSWRLKIARCENCLSHISIDWLKVRNYRNIPYFMGK